MEEKIKEIVESYLGVNPSDCTNESKFVEDLACYSLDMIEVIMECEREFNIAIPDDVVSRLVTIQDLIDYVKEHAA